MREGRGGKMENQVAKIRKGAWTLEEDALLQRCVLQYGEGQWHLIPERAGLRRCRKSCRLRWLNYLKPSIKRGAFQEDEVDLIIRLHRLLGNRWSLIAGRIPGRTANDIKNYWNSCLCKKVGAQGKVARNINKRSTIGLAAETYNSCIWGRATLSPRIAHPPEAILGCRHEIFRPRPRTMSDGPICLPDIITYREPFPGGHCCSSTNERPDNEQELVAWTRLLLEVFRPRPRTMSDGPICLPDIITYREPFPGGQCCSSTDERPDNDQELVAWTRLLLEDDGKDQGHRQQEEREDKDAISFPVEEELRHWPPQTDDEVEGDWWPLGCEDILLDANPTSGTFSG